MVSSVDEPKTEAGRALRLAPLEDGNLCTERRGARSHTTRRATVKPALPECPSPTHVSDPVLTCQ